ncbi:MAG: hypothetical protein M3331_04415 [Actinomycetota bacterium]|nr:hypothetical protein [Actinomycetota bacterium]
MAKKANGKSKHGKHGKTVHVSVLIDESGSMGGREEAVASGFNAFLAELRDGKAEARSRVSLAMFDLSGLSRSPASRPTTCRSKKSPRSLPPTTARAA